MGLRFLSAVAALLLSLPAVAQQSSLSPQDPPAALPALEHFNTTNVDSTADPCDDFANYSNGKWLAGHPIPADQVTWGVNSPLSLWNETVLVLALEQNSAANPKRDANEQKVGDYYYACMDTKTVNAQTGEWLKPELARIAAINNKAGITEEVAHLHQTIPGAWIGNDNETNAALLGFSGSPDYDDASLNVAFIDQGGMALPGRTFYLAEDDRARGIRSKYVKHIANMFVLAGESADQAASDANVVMEMETQMAKAAMDPVARLDPKNVNNKMSLAQVKALTPSFDWDLYLKTVKAPASPHYVVSSPDFFKAAELMLNQHPVDHWKIYLRWQMLHGNAPSLSDDFVNENFDFYGRTLTGAKELQPRWRRCTRAADASLGEALGQVYVNRAFPPESKQRVKQMVDDIQAALSQDINAADWMAPETKKQAQEKLRATLDKIGYPDHWRDYSAVTVARDSYLTNHHQFSSGNLTAFVFRRQARRHRQLRCNRGGHWA